ncbi:MAG: DUF7305 domain-containing protein [Myxococcota bacterium]
MGSRLRFVRPSPAKATTIELRSAAQRSINLAFLLVTGLAATSSCGTKVDTVAYGVLENVSGGTASALGGQGGAPAAGSTNGGTSAGDGGASAGEAGQTGSAGQAGSGGNPTGCADGYPRIARTSASGVSGVRCVGSFARERMSYALCSAGDLDVPGRIDTDAFDSTSGSSASGAAAVGANGEYLGELSPMIGGSLTIASDNPLLLPGLDVHGDLRMRGTLRTSGPIRVARDAWFAESVVSLTSARVERDVHIAPGKVMEGFLDEDVGGRVIREAFEIPLPCGSASDSTELTNVIANAAAENDNALIGLASDTLAIPSQAVDLVLPCGRFYATAIGGNRDVRLRVTGRAALFVAGDVTSSGKLHIDLATGAELDWFVGGRLAPSDIGVWGSVTRPAALRIYVAGTGPISVPRSSVFGNLYAPNADVVLSGIGDFHGSLSARSLRSLTDITVHYDVAVQRAADGCTEEVPSDCTNCGDCPGGQACVQGRCVSCGSDADCCVPFVCNAGRCSAFAE